MAGLGFCSPLIRNERGSMTPAAAHHKLAERFACPRSQLRLSQLFRKILRVAGVANGYGGNGLPALRNPEELTRFVMMEARHLMNDEAARGRFHSQLCVSSADIVLSDGVLRAIVFEVLARNGNRKYGGVFRPSGIHVHQDTEYFREILFVVLCGNEISPGLIVVAGRGPASRFEEAAQYLGRDRLIRECPRAPTLDDKIMNRMICCRWLLHCFLPFAFQHLMKESRRAVHAHRTTCPGSAEIKFP